VVSLTKDPADPWEQNLFVLATAQIVAVSAMGVILPMIPFFVRELGVTDRDAVERWSGWIFSGPFLAAGLMAPVWGHLGDRFGHKKMVIRAVFGLAIVNLALVFVRTPLQFYVLRLVQGLVTGFIPASFSMMAASTPPAKLPHAMARLNGAASAGRLIGPAIGGLLATMLPFRHLFLLVGGAMFLAAVFVAGNLREAPVTAADRAASPWSNLRFAMGAGRFRLALGGLLVSMASVSMIMPIFPLFVEDLLPAGTDPKVWTGVGFAVVAAFTLLGSWTLGPACARFGLKNVFVFSLALTAAALLLHPLARSVGPMLVARALLGLGVAGIAPVLQAMIGRESPASIRGGMAGYASAATILGFFVGPVCGGWLANVVGVSGVFGIAATIAVVCALLAALLTRRRGGPPPPLPMFEPQAPR